MIQYTKEYINELLDKYMDGTSSLDEEAILSQYLKGKNIPEEWLCYQQMACIRIAEGSTESLRPTQSLPKGGFLPPYPLKGEWLVLAIKGEW